MSQVKQMSAQEEKRQLLAKIKELDSKIPSVTNKELKLTTKIGEKGTINVYGLRRFPVCFYASEIVKFQKLFASLEFQKFITDNGEQLMRKEKESVKE